MREVLAPSNSSGAWRAGWLDRSVTASKSLAAGGLVTTNSGSRPRSRDLHRCRGQLEGDFAGGVGEGFEEDQADGGFQRRGEALAECQGIRASGCGGDAQLVLDG